MSIVLSSVYKAMKCNYGYIIILMLQCKIKLPHAPSNHYSFQNCSLINTDVMLPY